MQLKLFLDRYLKTIIYLAVYIVAFLYIVWFLEWVVPLSGGATADIRYFSWSFEWILPLRFPLRFLLVICIIFALNLRIFLNYTSRLKILAGLEMVGLMFFVVIFYLGLLPPTQIWGIGIRSEVTNLLSILFKLCALCSVVQSVIFKPGDLGHRHKIQWSLNISKMVGRFNSLYIQKLLLYSTLPFTVILARVNDGGLGLTLFALGLLWLAIIYDLKTCERIRTKFILMELVSQILSLVWVYNHLALKVMSTYESTRLGLGLYILFLISFLAHLFSDRLLKSEPEQ